MDDALQHVQVIDDVQLDREIGRGRNAIVYKGRWRRKDCAVKKMELLQNRCRGSKLSELIKLEENFIAECGRTGALQHSNIVCFFGVHISEHSLPSFVMELLHSNLSDLLTTKPHVPHETKIHFIDDVAQGLKYLHTRTPTIMHCDLTSDNVLVQVSPNMVAKIGYLGKAHIFDKEKSQNTREARANDFMPPEVLFNEIVYSMAMDIFSFACVCLHILSQKWPTPSQPVYADPTSNKLRPCSEAERRVAYMDGISDNNIKTLVTSCLNNVAEKRPSIEEVDSQLKPIVSQKKFSPSATLDQYPPTEAFSSNIEKLEELSFSEGQISLPQVSIMTMHTEIIINFDTICM